MISVITDTNFYGYVFFPSFCPKCRQRFQERLVTLDAKVPHVRIRLKIPHSLGSGYRHAVLVFPSFWKRIVSTSGPNHHIGGQVFKPFDF